MSTSELLNTGAEGQPLPRVVLSGAVSNHPVLCRVVLCGAPGSAEFESACHAVLAVFPPDCLTVLPNQPELVAWLGEYGFPDLLVLVQSWSDEFHFADFLTWPGAGPFSRLICTFGPWCISDGRSRQDFPLAVRVPLEHLKSILNQELQRLPGAHRSLDLPASDGNLPWTASRDEVFAQQYTARRLMPMNLADSEDASTRRVRYSGDKLGLGATGSASASSKIALNLHGTGRASGTPEISFDKALDGLQMTFEVRIHTSDHELALLWKDAVQACGWRVTVDEIREARQIVLWDLDSWNMTQALLSQFPESRIIALCGQVTADQIALARSAGAVQVLSKLLPLDELASEILQAAVP